MTQDEIRVLSDVSQYDEQTRQALATAIEIAYAAAKRGVLPNEAYPGLEPGDDYNEHPDFERCPACGGRAGEHEPACSEDDAIWY